MENVKLVTHAHDNLPDVVLAYDGNRVGANQQIGTSSARLQTARSYNKENMNKNESSLLVNLGEPQETKNLEATCWAKVFQISTTKRPARYLDSVPRPN